MTACTSGVWLHFVINFEDQYKAAVHFSRALPVCASPDGSFPTAVRRDHMFRHLEPKRKYENCATFFSLHRIFYVTRKWGQGHWNRGKSTNKKSTKILTLMIMKNRVIPSLLTFLTLHIDSPTFPLPPRECFIWGIVSRLKSNPT